MILNETDFTDYHESKTYEQLDAEERLAMWQHYYNVAKSLAANFTKEQKAARREDKLNKLYQSHIRFFTEDDIKSFNGGQR